MLPDEFNHSTAWDIPRQHAGNPLEGPFCWRSAVGAQELALTLRGVAALKRGEKAT